MTDLRAKAFADAVRAHRAVIDLMARHEADAITIACLFLKHRKPCLSFAVNNGNLIPLLEQIHEVCGVTPAVCTADAGYWSPEVPGQCAERGAQAYIAPDRQRRNAEMATADEPSSTPATARDQMRQTLRSPEGRAIYARRKAIVEPVNGQIKEARGFRRFLLRGMTAVAGQWALVCTGHNILKMYRASLAVA